jgi:hypothetical protein
MFGPERVPDSTIDTERADFLARDWEARLLRARNCGRDRANYRTDEAYRDGLLLQPLLRGDLHTWEYFVPPLIENRRLVAAIDGIRASYGYLGGRIDGLSLNRLMHERDLALGFRHPQFARNVAIVIGIVLLLGVMTTIVVLRRVAMIYAYRQQYAAPGYGRTYDSSVTAYADAPPPGFHKTFENGAMEFWRSSTGGTVLELSQTTAPLPPPSLPGMRAERVLREQNCSNGPYSDYVFDAKSGGTTMRRREFVRIPWKRGETLLLSATVYGVDAADPQKLEAPARFAQAMCEHAR